MLHHHYIVLATALLCVPAVFAQNTVEKPTQVNSDRNAEQLVARGSCYELYAHPGKDVNAEKTELDRAVSRFKELFGVEPPLIAVVVLDSPDKVGTYDSSALKTRGLRTLMWLDRKALRNMASSLQVIPELGWVLGVKDEAVQIELLIPVPGATVLSKGDQIKTLAGKPVTSLDGLVKTYGDIPVGESFSLEIQRGKESLAFNLKKPDGKDAPKVSIQSTPTKDDVGEMDPLSHEAGHAFLIAFADTLLGKKLADEVKPGKSIRSYGHPLVPDWFDEAVATWCEVPAIQSARWNHLRKQTDPPIPLERFFTMKHPIAEKLERLMASQPGQNVASGHRIRKITGEATTQLLAGTDAVQFYSQSLALASFLHEKEGPAFLRTTLESLLKGQSMGEVITRGKAIPKDMESLTKNFQVFIAKRNPVS